MHIHRLRCNVLYSVLIKVFYHVKPIIPRVVQIFLRRHLALYLRKQYRDVWPIDPTSATPPARWQGWPDDKQFAFILSHDVDTRRGYKNVLKLAALEEKLGFRSTFNFVPERYGEISLDLIAELKGRGFGVGVHGLKHDGKLFSSKKIFIQRAVKINKYLNRWQCRGFSSPSMHHRPEWLTELDIEYSISTFDTDPFEPQPDGVITIFPIWVVNQETGREYMEMPYTIPQDSTLFIILQEKTIDIWKRKIDWIAKHGGMALLNTHPDYMEFNDRCDDSMRYPIAFFSELLNYVKTRYRDRYFHDKTIKIVESLKKLGCREHIC